MAKKSSKLKGIIACLLAATVVAGGVIGGSLAYLQDEDSDVNVMTLGNVKIEQNEKQRDENGTLVGFEDNKALFPAVGDPAAYINSSGDIVDSNSEYKFLATADGNNLPNVVDKIITVKNTGESDAYVRTLIAFEIADDIAEVTERTDIGLMRNDITGNKDKDNATLGNSDWTWEWLDAPITVDGQKYAVAVVTHEAILGKGEETIPSLLQVYLKSHADNEYVAKFNGTYEILALSQAGQVKGFEDVGAATALNTMFGDPKENAAEWFGGVVSPGFNVSNDEEFAAAVANGETEIWLNAGTYNNLSAPGKTLTINGTEDAVIKVMNEGENGCDYGFGPAGSDIGNITFNGVTIDTTENTGNYKGFAYMKGTFNDCNFVGSYSLNNANDFVFNNCKFDFKNGYFWTWGAKSATFNGCTFNGNSKAILAHGWESTVITINNCTFAAEEKGYTGSGDNTAAVEIDPAGTNTYTINFTGNNTKTESYSGWTRIKDGSTGHTITGVN